jgi:hypothetical protein
MHSTTAKSGVGPAGLLSLLPSRSATSTILMQVKSYPAAICMPDCQSCRRASCLALLPVFGHLSCRTGLPARHLDVLVQGSIEGGLPSGKPRSPRHDNHWRESSYLATTADPQAQVESHARNTLTYRILLSPSSAWFTPHKLHRTTVDPKTAGTAGATVHQRRSPMADKACPRAADGLSIVIQTSGHPARQRRGTL